MFTALHEMPRRSRLFLFVVRDAGLVMYPFLFQCSEFGVQGLRVRQHKDPKPPRLCSGVWAPCVAVAASSELKETSARFVIWGLGFRV